MGKKSKQSTTSEPSAWAKGYITPALGGLQQTYQANQGAIQGIGNTLQNAFSQNAGQMIGASPLIKTAQGYAGDVLSGKYLGQGNPYLQSMIDTSNNSVQDRINAAFSKSGRSAGSSAQTYSLAKALGENENNLRYSDYGRERDAMAQASAGAAGLDAASWQNIPALLQLAQGGAQIPFLGSNYLTQGVGALTGGSNTSTQTSQPGTGQVIKDGIGQALQIASIFSDRRLKKDIEKIGQMNDGLGVYRYRYTFGGPEQTGVMADEVQNLRPWAMGETVNGFMTVNYEAL